MSNTVSIANKYCAAAAGIAVTAVTFGAFVLFNVNSVMGNLFCSTAPQQMVIYGRMAGIGAALVLLWQMLSMGNGRRIERFIPKAQLVKWHRVLGFGVLLLIAIHITLILWGKSLLHEESAMAVLKSFSLQNLWGAFATFGVLLLVAVLFCAALFRMKKMGYANWKKTHYPVYAVVILLFFHQIFCGLDFVSHAWFRWYWTAIFVVVMLDACSYRIRRIITK